MGAQRKIETPEMLEKHINDFIAKCEETGEIPSDYALCKFLSISPTTLDRFKYEEKDLRDNVETHWQCQKVETKSTHFSLPSARGELLNSRLTSGNTASSKEIRLFFNMVCTLEYCWYCR